MKKTILTLIAALTATVAANAVIITIGVDAAGGTNITNAGGNLYAFVPQELPFGPKSQGADAHADWLDSLDGKWSIQPGQIEQYNTIMGTSLAQPGSVFIDDDDASGNAIGYMFDVGLYYLVAHYGGANAAFYLEVTDALQKYKFATDGDDLVGNKMQVLKNEKKPEKGYEDLKAGGLSNITAFRVVNVPDSGTTLALLGAALLGVIGFRRFKK